MAENETLSVESSGIRKIKGEIMDFVICANYLLPKYRANTQIRLIKLNVKVLSITHDSAPRISVRGYSGIVCIRCINKSACVKLYHENNKYYICMNCLGKNKFGQRPLFLADDLQKKLTSMILSLNRMTISDITNNIIQFAILLTCDV